MVCSSARARTTTNALLLASALLSLLVAATGCAEGPSVTRATGNGDGVSVAAGLTRYDEASRALAPVLEGPAVDGGAVVSSSRPGRVVVINVWQSTCGPCRAESAALDDAARRTSRQASFIGLDVDDQQASAQAFLRGSASSYPHLYDPDGQQLLKLAGVLPLQAIPSTLVVDRHGRIAARIVGAVGAETLTQLIADTSSG